MRSTSQYFVDELGAYLKPLLAIPFLALLLFITTAQDEPAGTWLDSATVQWNTPGASFPKPPQDVEENVT